MDKTAETNLSYPAKFFQRGDPIHLRAQQAWVILAGLANNNQTVTYGDLSRMMGYGGRSARATIKPVALIAKFCLDNGLPQLNALVVNAATGVPGDEVILKEGDTSPSAQQRAFNYAWYEVRVPSPGSFRRVWAEWE